MNVTYVPRTILGSLYALSLILTIFRGISFPHFVHEVQTAYLVFSYTAEIQI